MKDEDRDNGLTLEHIMARIAVVDGWWQGKKRLSDDDWTPDKDYRYRTLFQTRDRFLGGLSYEEARIGYRIGRLAAGNPRYEGQSFDAVEAEIRAGWPENRYDEVAPYVRLGYERARFSRALERTRDKVQRLEKDLHGGWPSRRSPEQQQVGPGA